MIRNFFRTYGVTCVLTLAAMLGSVFYPETALAVPFLMSGATTTTASLDTAMKVIYSDPIITDIVNSSEIIDLFRTDRNVQSESTTGGKYIEMAHYLRLAG